MKIDTILAFTIVAWLAILSPGPAVLLALRNGASLGVRAVIWSSLGNITGIFCISLGSMLGLSAVLNTSAIVFESVKLVGALYLFYLGLQHIFSRKSLFNVPTARLSNAKTVDPHALYWEAFLLAATNPKPILFFTALFPQFVRAEAPLLLQFFVLTGIFMTLSFVTLVAYALISSRAAPFLIKPSFANWVNRVVGGVFVVFGAMLLSLRRTGA
jgi:homoserine/homoserine lactone efflux protein